MILLHFCSVSYNFSFFISNFYWVLCFFFLMSLANGLSILFIFSKNAPSVLLIFAIFFFIFSSFISTLLFMISFLLLTSGIFCSYFSNCFACASGLLEEMAVSLGLGPLVWCSAWRQDQAGHPWCGLPFQILGGLAGEFLSRIFPHPEGLQATHSQNPLLSFFRLETDCSLRHSLITLLSGKESAC